MKSLAIASSSNDRPGKSQIAGFRLSNVRPHASSETDSRCLLALHVRLACL